MVKCQRLEKETLCLDLELMTDYNKLSDAELYLSQHTAKTVIIDEVQRMPALFSVLRALIDQRREPARFILLGSANPEVVLGTSESLAGRIAYLELPPFLLGEIEDSYKISVIRAFCITCWGLKNLMTCSGISRWVHHGKGLWQSRLPAGYPQTGSCFSIAPMMAQSSTL